MTKTMPIARASAIVSQSALAVVTVSLTPLLFLLPQEKGKAGQRGEEPAPARPRGRGEDHGTSAMSPLPRDFYPTALVLPSAESKAGMATNS